jgi:carboxymethylenebutenolidase
MKHETAGLTDERKNAPLDRRDFLDKLGGGVGAVTLMSIIGETPASGQTVPKDDARLATGYITYPGTGVEMKAYSAMPKGDSKLPGVVVIHENRGLNPHIEDVARRVALEGYMAIAPDALTPLGGTPDDPNQATPLFQKLDMPSTIRNFVAAVRYLKMHPRSTGKVGVMGFCWGGGMTNQVAVNSPDVTAAVPFYGPQPAAEDVPKIKAALLLHYGADDARIDAGIPAFEAALKKASIPYTLYMYEGAGHAFFNDTNSGSYNKEAAQLAWKRTVAFLAGKLKT